MALHHHTEVFIHVPSRASSDLETEPIDGLLGARAPTLAGWGWEAAAGQEPVKRQGTFSLLTSPALVNTTSIL